MEKLLYPNCKSKSVVKNGFQKDKQRYKCKDCGKRFQSDYTYRAYNSNTNSLIKSLLKEGCGVRSIGRVLNISKNTVLSRKLKISKQIKVPYLNNFGCKFEIDEMFIRIGNKEAKNYLTYAIEQNTKNVIGFVLGSRNTENLRLVIEKCFYSIQREFIQMVLNIYSTIIPREIHKCFQHCTNKIERMNLNLRTHIKRLSRKTIYFSRNKIYLEAHFRIYFFG